MLSSIGCEQSPRTSPLPRRRPRLDAVERLRRVRAPIGLDLRSETPAEIAVSVAAEIVLVRRGGTGTPISEQERIVDRFFTQDDNTAEDKR